MQQSDLTADQLFQSAIEHSRRGDRAQATALCQQVLSQQPRHGLARYMLALTILEQGQLDPGIRELRQVLVDCPGHAGAHYSLGRALALTGQAAEAALQFEQAILRFPDGVESYVELARLKQTSGESAAAETLLRKALTRAPRSLPALNNLAALLSDADRNEEAIAVLRQALQVDPAHAMAHYNLGRALQEADDPDQALASYRQAVALKPDYVEAWHNLGNLLLERDQVAEAAEAYRNGVLHRRHPGATPGPNNDFGRTSRSKLQHDIEQLTHLIQRGIVPDTANETVGAYRAALAALPTSLRDTQVVSLPPEQAPALERTYNRLLHWNAGERLPGSAINPNLDRAAIEANYANTGPGITWFDTLLTPEALTALRRFCLDSTIWYSYKYEHGYLGAFMDDGFCCPLLLQIAEELRLALPGIFKQHQLRKLWAFKYDSQLSGIPVHGDFAAVNVNFWITPDDANLDPETGGLLVWDKEAPMDWDFKAYNSDWTRMRGFLDESGAQSVNVPHRQNRVVIFNSDLFHETGRLNFKPGYENRRINVTLLYGMREHEAR